MNARAKVAVDNSDLSSTNPAYIKHLAETLAAIDFSKPDNDMLDDVVKIIAHVSKSLAAREAELRTAEEAFAAKLATRTLVEKLADAVGLDVVRPRRRWL